MTKSRKNQKKPKNKRPKTTNSLARAAMSGMQASMDKYLRLLADPCEADTTFPPYMGTGSGYLCRTKQQVHPTGSTGAEDWLVDIHPGGVYLDAGANKYISLGTWGYAATTGGTLGPAQSLPFPTFLDQAGTWRAVAGCAKIWYFGSEMERKGIIHTGLLEGTQFRVFENIPPCSELWATCQRKCRLGDEAHEVRWIPNASDQNFIAATEPLGSQDPTYNEGGATIRIMGVGVPAGSCRVEVTFVWEWTPKQQGSLSFNPRPPLPYNLNSVLSGIRNLAEFATSPAAKSMVTNFGKGVYQVSRALPQIANAAFNSGVLALV